MSLHAIVSYDDTPNDQDALMLARVLQGAGALLTLAYVRHPAPAASHHEQLEEHEAHALLERGAQWLEAHDLPRRVVHSPSTGEGLRRLAQEEDADLIIFGSEYRTAPGHVSPGRSAQTLLEGGPTALAFAPASYRAFRPRVGTVALHPTGADDAAATSARDLAEALDAELIEDVRNAGLLVVASRPEAAPGQVLVSAAAQKAIEESTAPVLVIARGVPLRTLVLAAA